MSRLLSSLTLLWLLVVAVQPALGVVRVVEKNRAPEFFAEEATRVWEMPSSSQYGTRDAAPWSYESVSDVCEGPNLYAYVGNGPIGASDPLGLDFMGYDSWGEYFSEAGDSLEGTSMGLVELYSLGIIGPTDEWVDKANSNQLGGYRSAQLISLFGAFFAPRATPGMRSCPKVAPKIKLGSYHDKPPGWNENWQWHSSARAKKDSNSWRWRDPEGGEWRRHAPDRHHSEAHWDYYPNDSYNSTYHNVDNNGNFLLFSSP